MLNRAAPKVKTIPIIRHGATVMNNQTDLSEDRIRGWKDVPLSPEGIAEAHQAAADLSSFHIEIIFTSDLTRAQQTAEIIAGTCHCPVHATPLLRPWNLGYLQGAVTNDALPIIRKFVCLHPDATVRDGESFNTFKHRAIRGLLTSAKYTPHPCIVTHHRNERLYFSWRSAGFDPSLKIDLSTFLKKGEAPGAVLLFDLPLSLIGA
jgi:broad specificity phosphatase PhoE